MSHIANQLCNHDVANVPATENYAEVAIMELIDDKGLDSYDCNADNDGEKVEEEGDDDDDHAVEPDEEDKGGHR